MLGPLIVIYAGLGKLSFSWGCGAGTKYFKISLVCNASVFLNPLTVGLMYHFTGLITKMFLVCMNRISIQIKVNREMLQS